MKAKSFPLLLVLFFAGPLWAAQEPALVIETLTGTEQSVALSQIGLVTFARDSMFVYSKERTLLGKSNLREIQALRYASTDVPSGIEAVSPEGHIRIYPNPTQDRIIIEGSQAGKMYIFDLQGRLLDQRTLQPDQPNSLDVNHLPNGEYILLLNTQTFKIIKQ